MPRRRKRHPNWPYRIAWFAIIGSIVAYLALGTLIAGEVIGKRSNGTDWWMAFVATGLDATVAAWYFAVGTCIGSFLNVVAYRLPLGRSIGGHSGCPYCCTEINGKDNVPVLGWLKLRGRCRTCRLPISPQYPLIEFLVGLVFLIVFFTELGRGQANLPGMDAFGGLFRLTFTSTIILRQVTYLTVVCGLIAAGLITAKRHFVPLKLFAWSILPLVVCSLIDPAVAIVPWRTSTELAPVEQRLDALVTILCGMGVAIGVARMLVPVLFRSADRSLLSSNAETSAARAWIGGLAVCGAVVGWQAVVPMIWVIVGTWCVMSLFCLFVVPQQSQRFWVSNPCVWTWLGFVCFRANWKAISAWQLFPENWPEVTRHVVGALLLAPVCMTLVKLFTPAIEPSVEEDDDT